MAIRESWRLLLFDPDKTPAPLYDPIATRTKIEKAVRSIVGARVSVEAILTSVDKYTPISKEQQQ